MRFLTPLLNKTEFMVKRLHKKEGFFIFCCHNKVGVGFLFLYAAFFLVLHALERRTPNLQRENHKGECERAPPLP